MLVEGETFGLAQLTEEDGAELVLEVGEGAALASQSVCNRVEGALSGCDHQGTLVHLHHLCSDSEGTNRNYVNLVLVLELKSSSIEVNCAFGGTVNSEPSGEEDSST